MFKLFVVLLALPLMVASGVKAQETAPIETETELDKTANSLNVIPIEARINLQREVTKNIDLNLKNATKGEVSDIIKNTNLHKQRAAKVEGRASEHAVHIDPNNKAAVRNMLKQDLNLEPYPKFYE